MPSLIPAAPARAGAAPAPNLTDVPYQPHFDSLRALAVLTVTSDHFAAEIPNFPLPDSIHLGPVAVRLFLVLGGYFITASLRRTRERMDSGRLDARQAFGPFYRHRFFRILPPYGVFLLAGLVLNLGVMREKVFWIVTFTVNLLIAWKGNGPSQSRTSGPSVCRNSFTCFGRCWSSSCRAAGCSVPSSAPRWRECCSGWAACVFRCHS